NFGDEAYAVAVDGSGNAYVTGDAGSTDFPTANPLQATCSNVCGFITKFSSDGSAILYSTYLSGTNGGSGVRGIALDSSGAIYVTGLTSSSNFPVLNAAQSSLAGGVVDAFVTKISSDGSALVFSTYLGGNGNDQGSGI